MQISATTETKLVGSPSPLPQYDVRLVAMATSRVGWASATGLFAAETTYGMVTYDGGRHFREVFTAPQRIVDVAAPDVQHAYFLESDCISTGTCTSRLQLLSPAGTNPRTVWQESDITASALSFPNAQTGFIEAVISTQGNPGKPELLVTHDGGAPFAVLPSPCPGQPYNGAIDFTSPQQGWLLCGGAPGMSTQTKTLLETMDGGQDWSAVASSAAGPLPTVGDIRSLSFVSPSVGYMALNGIGILQTADGGKIWTKVFALETAGEHAQGIGADFLPGGFGWLLRSGPQSFLTTADGGRTWQPGAEQPAIPQWATDLGGGKAVAFAMSTGYVPRLLDSADGGTHWSPATPVTFVPTALEALSTQDVVMAGGDNVEVSVDAGRTWSPLPLRGWLAMGLGFASADDGWVVANQGQHYALFACDGRHCKELSTPFLPISATATGTRSGFADGQDAHGREGLFSTTDGGSQWNERLLPRGSTSIPNPHAYSGAGSRGPVRWLYRGSMILLSTDGGVTWKEIEVPSGEVQSLSFASASHGLMVVSSMGSTSLWATDDDGASFHLLQ